MVVVVEEAEEEKAEEEEAEEEEEQEEGLFSANAVNWRGGQRRRRIQGLGTGVRV